MKLSDINPHIRYASIHYYHFHKPFDSICYDCRLFFIKNGAGHAIADGREFSFSANTVLFFPPGTKYHFYPNKSSTNFVCIVLNFDLVNDFSHLAKSLGTASEHDYHPEQRILYPMPEAYSAAFASVHPSAAELLEKCCDEFTVQPPLYREVASTYLKLCLLELVRNIHRGKGSDKLLPIMDYLHTHYADPDLSNTSIANRFNYHPYYLSQIFRQYTGQSLHQYLISYRIKMAKKELVTTNAPVSTVAWRVGFSSPAYFTAQFKANTGTTPTAYRKDHMDFLF